MSLKILFALGLPGLGLVTYANWPSADINKQYCMKTAQAKPERLGEVGKLVETVKNWCRENRYDLLEKEAFALSPAERQLEMEASGSDPVEKGLAILRQASGNLDWERCEVVTYHNAPSFYDVTLCSKNGKQKILLRFNRASNGRYSLRSVENTAGGI